MQTSEPKLFVHCQRPGLIRAGVSHPASKGYAPNHFTAEQLEIMLKEPAITIVYGRQLQSENIADYLGAFEADSRTHFRGSSIDTDAGANAGTGVLAQENNLKKEVERVEAAAVAGDTLADKAAAVTDAAAASTDAGTIAAAADAAAGRGRRSAR